ncbi:MAG TPA: cupin domain-containing protein [Candidatus Acidoferrales bacterium]|nr:cupin domain-containing protein [Candidatus Acidoferrales bacterium]
MKLNHSVPRVTTIDASLLSLEDFTSDQNMGEHMPEIISWEKLETEKLNDKITRQMLFGEKAMLARIVLKRGAIVPRHSHVNEQITWIISGALKLIFDDGERILRSGQMLLIPANLPHAAEAMEDTVDIDIFAPPREDWIHKTDAYLRR